MAKFNKRQSKELLSTASSKITKITRRKSLAKTPKVSKKLTQREYFEFL